MPFTIECVDCVNYSLFHCGLQQVICDAMVPKGTEATVSIPGFSRAELHLTEGRTSEVSPPLDSVRFAALADPAEAQVLARCSNGEHLVRSIAVLPLRAWDQRKDYAIATAAFVLENDPFVLRIVRKAEANPHPSAPRPSILPVWKRIYEACTRSFEACYLFDRGVLTAFNNEQYVRFPSQIHWDLGGTCIDLVLFFAAVALAAQLQPVVIILGNEDSDRHALAGVWLSSDWEAAVVPGTVVRQEVDRGRLIALETTWITQDKGFDDALQEGKRRVLTDNVLWGVDIQAARLGSPQVRPLPEAADTIHLGRPTGFTDAYTSTRMQTAASILANLRLEVVSVRAPGDAGRHWDLRGYAVTIGRSPQNQVRLADPTVSREHAVLFTKDGELYIKDLCSPAGTVANGNRLEPLVPHPIGESCDLRIGAVDLRLAPRDGPDELDD